MGGSTGGGHGMMGYGPNLLSLWGSQHGTNPNYQNQRTNTTKMREEIRAKRQELSALYRSQKSDKEMINQKIKELSKLEAQLDQEMSGRY